MNRIKQIFINQRARYNLDGKNNEQMKEEVFKNCEYIQRLNNEGFNIETLWEMTQITEAMNRICTRRIKT